MKWLIAGNFSIALISLLISAFILKELEVSDFEAAERSIITQENELKELSRSQENLTEVLKDTGLLLEELEAQHKSLYRDVNVRKQVIDEEISSIKKRIKNDSEANALIEIEHLIRRANQQSLFERNFAAALLIMKEVSSRLEENSSTISDFALVKEAIDKDIELLKKSDLLDISRIYREIDDIVDAIASSTFIVNKEETPENDRNTEHAQASFEKRNTDSTFTDILITELSKLVEFGKLEDGFKPILSVEEDHLLRQQLNTNLNIAQLSLLRGNNEIFQESLSEAKELLIPYLQFNEELERIHGDINALDAIIIEQKGPPLSGSLAQIRNSIKKVIGGEFQ
ncbi:uroporphyrinogen-III C-methyltransferase [Gammaproteobacteria bacterium]|nr:uroporphyrinogen-III C-methyltransferase [Gammaproteobacteria bacterium]